MFDLATDDRYQVADVGRVPEIQGGGSRAVRRVNAGSCTVHLPHKLQCCSLGDEHVIGSRLLLGVVLGVDVSSCTTSSTTCPGAITVVVQGDSFGCQVVAHADVVIEVGQLLGEGQQLFLGDTQVPL